MTFNPSSLDTLDLFNAVSSSRREQEANEKEPATDEWQPWGRDTAATASKADIEQYIRSCLDSYAQAGTRGRDLYREWKSDFVNFTEGTFKRTTEATKALRDYLRAQNVYVLRAARTPIARCLINARDAPYEPLPDDQKVAVHEPAVVQPGPSQQHSFDRPTTTTFSQGLTTLTRLYSDDLKYGGEMTENFSTRFNTFVRRCDDAGIPESQLNKAFEYMLKGAAHSHYMTLVTPGAAVPPLEQLVKNIRETFEGKEHRVALLNKWNSLTLQSVIEEAPEKDLEESIRSLTTQLRSIQVGLGQALQDSEFFHNKLLTACRSHPAMIIACTVAPPTVTGLITMLLSAAATHKASVRSTVNLLEDDDSQPINQFFTDRRYHQQRSFNRQPGNSNRESIHSRSRTPFSPQNAHGFRYHGKRPKTCYVCSKIGCWSSNHTNEERLEARNQFKDRYNRFGRQHLTEQELDDKIDQFLQDDEDDLVNQFDEFLLQDDEHFFTDCGRLDHLAAKQLTTSLCNNSTTHLLTADVADEVEISPQSFLIKNRYGSSVFHGILIDTGASGQSTAGQQQVKAFEDIFGSVDLDQSHKTTVKFGIGETTSVGRIQIESPIGSCVFNVVTSNTPFLLSLQDLDRKNIIFNNLNNTLVTEQKQPIPVVRKFGHAFLQWGPTRDTISYLTETELRTLHRRFGHPSAQRLCTVLERAGHDDPSHRSLLDSITKICNKCQRYGAAPMRFKFTLHDNTIDFNHSVFVDVMYIDGSPVLHVVDEATRFQAACFLPNMSASSVWESLRLCWLDTYLGPPDVINHDAGTNFTSSEFNQYATSLGITTKGIPVEAANSMGIVERYHKPLRRAFQIIQEETRSNNKRLILQMAVKAVNDTAGPDGMVPTLLVFGAYPRMVATNSPAPDIATRARAIQKAMGEVTKLRAQRQVRDALQTRNGPITADPPIGSQVLVWRTHHNRWEGPFKLLSIQNELATVELPSGPSSFRSTSIKEYTTKPTPTPTEPTQAVSPTQPVVPAQIPIPRPDHRARRQLPWITRPQRERRLPARYCDDDENSAHLTVFLTEPDFANSRQAELDGLIERGVFEFVNLSELPPNCRLFNSRFVDQVKNEGTPQAFEKSRLVIQAYNDQGKQQVLTQSPTIQRASQRLLLCVAIMRGLQIYSRDISQAYTQSKTPLSRNIFAKPPFEMKLPQSTILRVKLPLYGIPEAGNHWFRTYHDHHTAKLQLQQSASDPCLLFNGHAILALQTDDTLFACNDLFREQEENELQKAGFIAKAVTKLTPGNNLTFNGATLTISHKGDLTVTQSKHCQAIKPVEPGIKEQFVAQRARGAYISSVCQPQAAYDLSKAAQAREPSALDTQALNKRLEWQMKNASTGLCFTRLDEQTLQIITFTDGSFANNQDLSSQIGFVIVIADGDSKCNLIQWSSTKCKRVTRSVLASELYAMAAGFDAACVLKHTLDQILGRPIPLVICIDSFSLYECLVKLGTTREKRLMIDIGAIRQAYERREIAEIVWIKGGSNPADAMTKSGANDALSHLVSTNSCRIEKEAWVERDSHTNDTSQ